MKIKLAISVILAASLAACGGGGSPLPDTEVTATTSCGHVVRIQLFGDSTQWGYLPEGGGARAAVYPELVLQREMDRRFGAGAVIVETRAVSGSTSGHLLAGTDGVNLPWPRSVSADIVVINPGINDVSWGVPAAEYQKTLRALAVAPAQVVFETPLPTTTRDSYDAEMRQVATDLGAPVADAAAYAKRLPGWWKLARDGVHPDGDGYELIVKNVLYPVLVPLVEDARCRVRARALSTPAS